jgi:predicted RNase H-like nuclease
MSWGIISIVARRNGGRSDSSPIRALSASPISQSIDPPGQDNRGMASKMDIAFVGFDSAWADNPKAPGAICAISYDGQRFFGFKKPELVSFDEARSFISAVGRTHKLTLIAIDQPTIVPNQAGMRPAEKVAASAISWLGGGVQPANRKKASMFGVGAPIWKFKRGVRAVEDPERSRSAKRGKFLVEVFPALALPSFNRSFCGLGKGPRYNPARRFNLHDWDAVISTVLGEARRLRCEKFVNWCCRLKRVSKPRKRHQDKLDAAICLLIAIHWRQQQRKDSVMIGDLRSGYIVAPVVPAIKKRLRAMAIKREVALDGTVFSL